MQEGLPSLNRSLITFIVPIDTTHSQELHCQLYHIMAASTDFALPQGSTVLITGSNGFLGAHIMDQFLQRGYKVRGTVRDVNKESWLVEHFDKLYGTDNFELVAVPRMEVEGAFDEVVKGSLPRTDTLSVVLKWIEG